MPRPSRLALPATLITLAAGAATARAQNFARYAIGPQANDDFGRVVAALGDIDGDGGQDYAVGAPLYDYTYRFVTWTDAGRVHLYNGRTGALIRTQYGGAKDQRFGAAISAAPDCDGDGIKDYAIGSPGFANGAGRCAVFSAATGAEIWHFDSQTAGRELGSALALIADANGDGSEELAIGCPEPNGGAGYVYVRDRLNQTVFTIAGFQSGSRFGATLSRGPDLDHDGRLDFLVGAPLADVITPFSTAIDAGAVYSMSGTTGSLIFSQWELASGAHFGSSIALLLDTNYDGAVEFIVGAPDWSNHTGFVCVYSGATGSKLYRVDSTWSNNEWFGQAVCSAGDWNQDGRGDFVVGIPGYTGNGCGGAEIRSGRDGALLLTIDALFFTYGSGEGNGAYGSALAAGLFDQDFAFDFVVGDPGFRKSGVSRGSYHLVERF